MFHGESQRFSAAIRVEIGLAIERIRNDAAEVSAGCCSTLAAFPLPLRCDTRREWPTPAPTSSIVFEDQDGELLRFDDWCRGQPTIVVFFYTRCDNPNKCSLTISKLAHLQDAIVQRRLGGRLRTMAITYDRDYDIPVRLHQYGRNRGVLFGPDHRLVRTYQGEGELKAFFDPGVNYGAHTVNRHRIDLFVLDRRGEIAVKFARAQWTVDRVLEEAVALLDAHEQRAILNTRIE
jgi:protein SCO1/2